VTDKESTLLLNDVSYTPPHQGKHYTQIKKIAATLASQSHLNALTDITHAHYLKKVKIFSKEKEKRELYTDSLNFNRGFATVTVLSAILDGEISHDKVTRFLSEREYTSKDLRGLNRLRERMGV
jgi:hypothetical protein